tara:strand:- start:45 stop:350 length:306 start_codon:yes stop_codon:yes gene_type:complete
MNYSKQREMIEKKIFDLQDKVAAALLVDSDVDKFLDNTIMLDEWENIIPEEEYGIFVIAVLNNIRKKTIIDTIIDSILKVNNISNDKTPKLNNIPDQHPFC